MAVSFNRVSLLNGTVENIHVDCSSLILAIKLDFGRTNRQRLVLAPLGRNMALPQKRHCDILTQRAASMNGRGERIRTGL
jgi:hypothetical protein